MMRLMFLMIEKWVPAIQKLPTLIRRVYVLLVVVLGFVLFNAADMTQAAADIKGMFGFGGVPLVTAETLYYLRSYGVVFILSLIGATPLVRDSVNRLMEQKKASRLLAILEPAVLILLLLLCTAYLVDGSFNPFLYFRF